MKYDDGTVVRLGDIIQIPMQHETSTARVVMLGDTQAHLAIDESFRAWAVAKRMLDADAVVVEWVGKNPLAHDDPGYAPIGDYMFTRLDGCIRKTARGTRLWPLRIVPRGGMGKANCSERRSA
jgi:hypothetical protein